MYVEEEWKDIEGFEGRYQVSNFGRVRSVDITYYRKGKHSSKQSGKEWSWKYRGRVLKPLLCGPEGNRQETVRLYNRGKRVSKSVRKLVREAFQISGQEVKANE